MIMEINNLSQHEQYYAVQGVSRICIQPIHSNNLENILSLILQKFLYLEAFKCKTTSDWLNHTV